MTDYITLPAYTPTIIAAWVVAAWLSVVWDRFPHLSIYSPEKRCGKTRLLEVLKLIVPNPTFTSSISPAALYRVIGGSPIRPTLILDEAQSLSRVRSESAEALRELLNAGIEKDAKVFRCGGKKMEQVKGFPIYSPKIFAQIGEPDAILADRSLPIEMKRKTGEDVVQRFHMREVQPRAQVLKDRLERWASENEVDAVEIYAVIDPLGIANDRMEDLLMPLQAVLMLDNYYNGLDTLSAYATSLDERDKRQESQSSGVQLLAACREIFESEKDTSFMPTTTLIENLVSRKEEPWHRWNRGEGMNPEALAKLLRPYKIRPTHNKDKTQRGYYVSDFFDAFERYLLPLEKPSSPSSPSGGSKP
ncbi:MAG: hypothetical protein QOF89_764 [Acidobacteriota bacterium]|nr:hypothetical protein [Acidobacteriota bacterium]